MILHIRLLLAFVVSLLLHLMLLAIPIGKLESSTGTVASLLSLTQGNFASLEVRFIAFAEKTHQQNIPDEEKSDRHPQVASTLDSSGMGNGKPFSFHADNDQSMMQDISPQLGVPLPYYYQPQELSQRARILRDIDPKLGEYGEIPGQGKAILTLLIDEAGGVNRVEAEISNLPETLEKVVIRQFLGARFQPAEREGVPVKSMMRIEVEVLPRSPFDGQQPSN